MISKELFVEATENLLVFNDALERLGKAISGRKYCSDLYESDWTTAVGKLYDNFLESHFTDDAQELIYWYLYEDVPKIIYETKEFFGKKEEIETELNSLDDLYEYLRREKLFKCSEY